MPTKEAAELQHSREFVEEQDAAVMRQTPVAKGDFHISRRSTHPDLNLTKSDVKVTMKICSGSPARSVRNSHPMPFFTPDSGRIHLRLRQDCSNPNVFDPGRGQFDIHIRKTRNEIWSGWDQGIHHLPKSGRSKLLFCRFGNGTPWRGQIGGCVCQLFVGSG